MKAAYFVVGLIYTIGAVILYPLYFVVRGVGAFAAAFYGDVSDIGREVIKTKGRVKW